MTGLLLKDMLVMRKTLKTYVLFLAFYVVMAVLGIFSLSMVTAMIQIIVIMLPISAFAYDEQAKWERYAMTLPAGRATVVRARYVFVLLMSFSAAAFGLLACVLLSILGQPEVMENLAVVIVTLGVGLFIADVLLPLSYKLGPERARPFLYVVVFVPVILIFGASKLGLLDDVNFAALNTMSTAGVMGLFALVPLLGLAGLAASYLISCRIVANKEY